MTPHFDQTYYDRYYVNPKTRIYTQRHHAKLVAGIVSLIEWFGHPIDRVLDVGAGLGWWRDWIDKHRPSTEVTSTEMDRSICQKYGHRQADIAEAKFDETFDLVVCQGVLPYLDDARAEAAILNLAAMTGGFLYLEAVTREDLRASIDPVRTDLGVTVRSNAWYRRRLKPHFREIGAGLFAARSAEVPFFALEAQR